MSIVYPKLHHDEKRSTKLTLKEVQEIQRDFPNNPNYKIFAEKYNVGQSTIRYWVDSEYKRKRNDYAYKRLKEKLKDPEFSKHYHKLCYESKKVREINFPQQKIWFDNYIKTDEYKQKFKEYLSRPEVKIRIQLLSKNEEIRKKEIGYYHTTQYLENKRKYRQTPEVKERKKEYYKLWYKNNPEKCASYSKKWNIKNKEWFKNYNRDYYQKNKEGILKHQKSIRKLKIWGSSKIEL